MTEPMNRVVVNDVEYVPAARATPPIEVLDALDSWLESEQPNGVEVTSDQADQSARWARVRAWRLRFTPC